MTLEQLRGEIAVLKATGATKNAIAGRLIESLCQRAATADVPLSLLLLDKATAVLKRNQAANTPRVRCDHSSDNTSGDTFPADTAASGRAPNDIASSGRAISNTAPSGRALSNIASNDTAPGDIASSDLACSCDASTNAASSALANLLTDIDQRRQQAASAARHWVDGSGGGDSEDLDDSDPGGAPLQNIVNTFEGSAVGELQELTSVRLFRESLVKLSSDKLVSRIIKEAPENPGPLNPQMLVIRSLSTMRDLSPDYLNRFVAYVDTLQWLEQATLVKKSNSSRSASSKSIK
jgi:hypothetical protein